VIAVGGGQVRLSDDASRQRFGEARVARLATMSAEGQPHIVPITFAVDGDVIYTAVDSKPKSTPHLRRISNIHANPRVAVLADHYDEDWSVLWWVRADGMAAILDIPTEMASPTGLLAKRYPQYRDNPPRGPVIAIRVARWTGWSAA
jgi:PPOX class probable F420-dependent enzyme